MSDSTLKNMGLDIDAAALAQGSGKIRKAATVMVLRDSQAGLQTLMLRRSGKGDLASDIWVFPGGAWEEDDAACSDELALQMRQTAWRETQEEAGIDLNLLELKPYTHWTTPAGAPKRFATWFFLSSYQADDVVVDGVEMVEHQWLCAQEALAMQAQGSMTLLPPTYIALTQLQQFSSARDAIAGLSKPFGESLLPKACLLEQGVCMLYPGDSGYESGEVSLDSIKHRFYMLSSGWRYENTLEE